MIHLADPGFLVGGKITLRYLKTFLFCSMSKQDMNSLFHWILQFNLRVVGSPLVFHSKAINQYSFFPKCTKLAMLQKEEQDKFSKMVSIEPGTSGVVLSYLSDLANFAKS